MKIGAHQLKELSKKYAFEHNISAQEVLQNYMLERVLFRISNSQYSSKFILKGGLFISSLIGLAERTTMDLDANVRGIELDSKILSDVLLEILAIDGKDGIHYKLLSIENIKEDEEYKGLRFKIMAFLESIKVNLSFDLSAGDCITPNALYYDYPMIFEQSSFKIMTYSIETVLAEKLHAILELNGTKGRMKDFYDIHYFVITKSDLIDFGILKEAVKNTFLTRKSLNILNNIDLIMIDITYSSLLRKRWDDYSQKHEYSKEISFESTLNSISLLIEKTKQ